MDGGSAYACSAGGSIEEVMSREFIDTISAPIESGLPVLDMASMLLLMDGDKE